MWGECASGDAGDGGSVGVVGALVVLRYVVERVDCADVARVWSLAPAVAAIAAAAPPSLLSPARSTSACAPLPSVLCQLARAIDTHSARLLEDAAGGRGGRGEPTAAAGQAEQGQAERREGGPSESGAGAGAGAVSAAEVARALFLQALQPLARRIEEEGDRGDAKMAEQGVEVEEPACSSSSSGGDGQRRPMHSREGDSAASRWPTAVVWSTWMRCRERVVRGADEAAAEDIERQLDAH